VTVRELVKSIFDADPLLASPENYLLLQWVNNRENGLTWDKIS
jgi:hypothetical protein